MVVSAGSEGRRLREMQGGRAVRSAQRSHALSLGFSEGHRMICKQEGKAFQRKGTRTVFSRLLALYFALFGTLLLILPEDLGTGNRPDPLRAHV